MTARVPLHIVDTTPAEPDPEVMLAELVPELIRAEETLQALQGLVDSWRFRLAAKRRVAFIRSEAVRREFVHNPKE